MPGLLRGVARTAVIAGTATTVSNRVSRRQGQKWAAQEQQAAPPPQQYAAPPPAAPPPRRRGWRSARAAQGAGRPQGAGSADRRGVRGREGAHPRQLTPVTRRRRRRSPRPAWVAAWKTTVPTIVVFSPLFATPPAYSLALASVGKDRALPDLSPVIFDPDLGAVQFRLGQGSDHEALALERLLKTIERTIRRWGDRFDARVRATRVLLVVVPHALMNIAMSATRPRVIAARVFVMYVHASMPHHGRHHLFG